MTNKPGLKRLNNLYDSIISLDNLELADARARRRKKHQPSIIAHDRQREVNLWRLHCALADGLFRTSSYTTFKVFEPKERLVYRLPYYPDRIVHHAILNILEPLFVAYFIGQTYSCIKGRGIHGAARAAKKGLVGTAENRYCLKLDLVQFYPSINHDILKALLRRKFKDPRLFALLDEIIDSAPGLPIGNYLSQYLANFYLTGFDHWLKEQKRVRHYFRYADDLVILGGNKEDLHALLADIRIYLWDKLRLQIKDNYQVFPVEARGIDFVGYVFYPTHTRLRKSIKQNFARAVRHGKDLQSIVSYWGWAKHCNSNHLVKKLLCVIG